MLAKISLALSALLTIAVVYLLMKSKSPDTVTTGELPTIAPALTTEGGPRPVVLAYVNADTLNAKYKYILDKSKSLESTVKSADKKVDEEYQRLEKDAQTLVQQYQQNPNMSEEEKYNLQQMLAELEGEMQDIQRKAEDRVIKENENLSRDLQSRMHKFLETYAKAHGIDYIMNYQKSINLILYGNPGYDITNDVIKGLNEEYEAEKK